MSREENGFDSWIEYIEDQEDYLREAFSKIINIHLAYRINESTPQEIAEDVDKAIEESAKNSKDE